jgi:hypothetical protein
VPRALFYYTPQQARAPYTPWQAALTQQQCRQHQEADNLELAKNRGRHRACLLDHKRMNHIVGKGVDACDGHDH